MYGLHQALNRARRRLYWDVGRVPPYGVEWRWFRWCVVKCERDMDEDRVIARYWRKKHALNALKLFR